jgi:hypothetical protein
MKKLFVQGLLLFIIIVLGWAVVHEYFSYVGPELARQQAITADLKQLKVEKEKLLLLNRAVEERLRIEKTTDGYSHTWTLFLLLTPASVSFILCGINEIKG